MNAIMHNGLSGMLQSQQAMQQSAHNITSAKPSSESAVGPSHSTHNTPSLKANTPAVTDAASANNTVNAPRDPSRVNSASESSNETLQADRGTHNSAQELINLQQQKQLFTASASIVKVGAEAVGSLIDDYS